MQLRSEIRLMPIKANKFFVRGMFIFTQWFNQIQLSFISVVIKKWVNFRVSSSDETKQNIDSRLSMKIVFDNISLK